jgi:hypothetical protein
MRGIPVEQLHLILHSISNQRAFHPEFLLKRIIKWEFTKFLLRVHLNRRAKLIGAMEAFGC